ncbi:MAG: DUF3048 domain-containing protein [Rudaea sp.]
MPAPLPRLLRASSLFLLLAIILFVTMSCTSPTPEPGPDVLPTELTGTPDSVPPSRPPARPIGTGTANPTPSPSASATSSLTPDAGPSATPRSAPRGGGAISGNVWFMSQLLAYFGRLGDYPPEPPMDRASNIDPLTGLEVSDPSALQRRPLLVRLGNDAAARPQAGLNQADLVFEEMIDQNHGAFAITRFTAVFLGQDATVRPLRSARQVNASLQPMFDGALAHSGAGKGVRYLFSNLPWGKPTTRSLNLDDLWYGSAYCVIGSSWMTRVASTTSHIREVLRSQNHEEPVSLRGFEFSEFAPAGAPASSMGLDHAPWPQTASVSWKYDAGSGRYLRFSNGIAHNTQQYGIAGKWGGACAPRGETTTEPVSASNVVVLNVAYDPTDGRDFTEDTLGSTSVFIEMTGSGPARIYRDGVEIQGTWARPTLQHFFRFVDASGNTIPLKPGRTWFELAPLGYNPTVK